MDTILFDLDGTLLSMNLDEFIQRYFGLIKQHFKDGEYDHELILNAIMMGTQAMQKNDGTQSNEAVFWDTFTNASGIQRAQIEDRFNRFYHEDFQKIEEVVEENKHIIEAVDILKEKGYRLIVATNPIFPKVASHSRLRWSGVDVSAFDFVTTYEDFHYCKPNVNYFKEILETYEVDPSTCIMVGNDSLEDGIIETLNIPAYLIDDHLIHREETPPTPHWMGDSQAFLEIVKSFPKR